MELNEYQEQAEKTINKALSDFDMLECACYGLMGEVGKLAALLNTQRFKGSEDELMDALPALKDILGDTLWYAAEASTAIEERLSDIAERNLNKTKRLYPNGR
jgi:NTP pyrophosphatase (non-canonical NTP hydrolase)